MDMKNRDWKKIYFDMDGVLADFDGGLWNLAGFKHYTGNNPTGERDDQLWAAVRTVDHYFDKLEPLPGAIDMFFAVYDMYPEAVEVLSAPPKPRRNVPTACDDKRSWCARYITPDIPVNLAFSEDKQQFCLGEDYLLIDDRTRNVEEWRAAGGTAILHESPEETLKLLGIELPWEDNE